MTVNATTPTIRDDLNAADANRLSGLLAQLKLGELLALLIQNLPATESGAGGIAANVKTLAHVADVIYDVQATASNLPNPTRLTLLKGGASIVPTSGQCVWDGGSIIRFAVADAVTQASIWYARGDASVAGPAGSLGPTVSLFQRSLGQRDPV